MNVCFDCRNCGYTFDVDVELPVAAQPFGPVERSHDGSAAEFEGLECPMCDTEADRDDVLSAAFDALQAGQEDEWERDLDR